MRIETWLESHASNVAQTLRPPATEREWSRAEQIWGVTLHGSLLQFYSLHNGGAEAIAGEDWFSLTEAIHERETWLALIPEFEQVAVQPKTWFPFAGSGDQVYALDVHTGVVWKSESVDHAERVAESLNDFLEQLAQDLESNRYVVDPVDGILHRDYEEPGRPGPTSERDEGTPVGKQLSALVALRRPLLDDDVEPLKRAATQDLVAALTQAAFAEDVGARTRAVAIVAAGMGHRDPAWARTQLNDETLGEFRFDVARLCLDAEDAVEWAWCQRRTSGSDIQCFARLALPELLGRIEACRDELEARAEWGPVVYSCQIEWFRLKRWLEDGGVLRRIALDALAWPFRVNPRLPPIKVELEELKETLGAVLEREPTPRAKRAVRDILSGQEAAPSSLVKQHGDRRRTH
ncbi:MAG TPA: SMI1/KNR4 family protein [Polyangiaceae bacterium]|nr:SMI1/KNR4 family protein [Polyangiaceae bacterium]